jgi:plastocyanin
MEERERQARKGAGGRASALARWVPFVGVSAAVAVVLVTPAAAGSGVLADAEITANSNSTFTPAALEVNSGDTVTWRNAGGIHDVVFEDGARHPPGGASSDAWSYPRTLTQPGIYRYYCSVHGTLNSGMRGSVTVVAAPSPPGDPPPPSGGNPPPGGGNPPPGGGNPPPGGGGDEGGGGGGGSPGGRADTTVTLQVSDATPTRGARVRFFGTVRPARDGRLLQLQRRSRGGSYLTVARIRLTDAGSARSKFSKRLRVMGDAVFRARLPADRAHEVGISRTRRLNVP